MDPQVFSKDGLSLRWWEAPAMGAVRQVMVEVSSPQAGLGQAMRVLYSVAGGPEQAAPTWPKGANPETGAQRFAAILPGVGPNTLVQWRPVVGTLDPFKTPMLTDESVPAQETNRFPYAMDFLARVTVPLSQPPKAIGKTPDGLQIVFPIDAGGAVAGPKLNGAIDHVGGDWMKVRPDGIGISNIRVVITTTDGTPVMGDYTGVVDFGPDGYDALASGGGPAEASVQLVPRFLTASKGFEWLNRLQCAGLGKVTMATLLVEYDLYAMQSLAIAQSQPPGR